MPNDKSYGSPYKMRAGKMGPMQKNFGASLAINKKLDKDNMAGGLTGKPSTGELDGPLTKNIFGTRESRKAKRDKFRARTSRVNKKIQTTAKNIGKNAKVDLDNIASKVGLKKTSLAERRAKKALRKPGESSFQANKRIASANRKQSKSQMKKHKENPQAAIDAADKKFGAKGIQVKG
jgi:hypothetical protein|tara:strand:+ start:110 stop:643 length:534 start_codon:yes stop_codon:yes gene_type:complete